MTQDHFLAAILSGFHSGSCAIANVTEAVGRALSLSPLASTSGRVRRVARPPRLHWAQVSAKKILEDTARLPSSKKQRAGANACVTMVPCKMPTVEREFNNNCATKHFALRN